MTFELVSETGNCFPQRRRLDNKLCAGRTVKRSINLLCGPAEPDPRAQEGGAVMPREDLVKIVLPESELPSAWYNILPELPGEPLPPLHPGTMQPAGPSDLAPLFPEALIMQEMSPDKWIDIPGEVLDVYKTWRPSPLFRARRLEKSLGLTPGKQRIYYKWEGVSPGGSHKPNTAVPQAFYNKHAGTRKLTTETGAGQWGSSLAYACALFGLECAVYMVKVSYEQKPYRRVLMETWGATVLASPSDTTQAGKNILKDHPDSTGSLGIAISEAVEVAAGNDDTHYALGSVLNHVCTHQTVVGLEAQKQMAAFEDVPDVVVGCVGGGSNFAGLSYPFAGDVLAGKAKTRFVAVEPDACPTLTRNLCLRLRRHRGNDPADAHVHIGSRLRPRARARRRTPLSRRRTQPLRIGQGGTLRG